MLETPGLGIFRAASIAAFLCAAPATADVEASGTKRIALTFDDLPYVSGSYPWTLERAQRTTDAILDVLGRYDAPATAFVNESQLYAVGEIDERAELLQRWIAAGALLGNHTFSHVSLNDVSVELFKEEIVRGDIVIRRLMEARDSYQLYFRHPQTHTGNTEEKKTEIQRFLAERGYQVAPHTVDSEDYIFNAAYLDSEHRGDEVLSKRICAAYVEFVGRATDFAEEISSHMFGRTIPQTIILHANDINADCLDDLLHSLEERRYEFISLDTAVADPAYETPDTLVTQSGPSWLWRWTRSMNLDVSFREDPEPPDWIVEAYRRRFR